LLSPASAIAAAPLIAGHAQPRPFRDPHAARAARGARDGGGGALPAASATAASAAASAPAASAAAPIARADADADAGGDADVDVLDVLKEVEFAGLYNLAALTLFLAFLRATAASLIAHGAQAAIWRDLTCPRSRADAALALRLVALALAAAWAVFCCARAWARGLLPWPALVCAYAAAVLCAGGAAGVALTAGPVAPLSAAFAAAAVLVVFMKTHR
jgi:hypothetical protein